MSHLSLTFKKGLCALLALSILSAAISPTLWAKDKAFGKDPVDELVEEIHEEYVSAYFDSKQLEQKATNKDEPMSAEEFVRELRNHGIALTAKRHDFEKVSSIYSSTIVDYPEDVYSEIISELLLAYYENTTQRDAYLVLLNDISTEVAIREGKRNSTPKSDILVNSIDYTFTLPLLFWIGSAGTKFALIKNQGSRHTLFNKMVYRLGGKSALRTVGPGLERIGASGMFKFTKSRFWKQGWLVKGLSNKWYRRLGYVAVGTSAALAQRGVEEIVDYFDGLGKNRISPSETLKVLQSLILFETAMRAYALRAILEHELEILQKTKNPDDAKAIASRIEEYERLYKVYAWDLSHFQANIPQFKVEVAYPKMSDDDKKLLRETLAKHSKLGEEITVDRLLEVFHDELKLDPEEIPSEATKDVIPESPAVATEPVLMDLTAAARSLDRVKAELVRLGLLKDKAAEDAKKLEDLLKEEEAKAKEAGQSSGQK